MKFKKELMLEILILFLVFIFLINFVGGISDEDKIDEKVYEKLENNKEVRVIVKIDVENNLEEQKTKEEVIKDVGKEDVKHIFSDEIAVEISKNDLKELNNNPNIESVVIDKPIFAFLQQSIPYINASLVWPIQISGENITGVEETVCIIDTGINFTHPDLIGKNKTCIIDCVGKTCVENCSIGDDNGHGTHVAGIVAASGGISGVGPNISLVGVKVLNSAGTGSGSDLNAGIDWCIANRNTHNISIISMSLGDCTNHNTYCNDDSSASHINNATYYNISVVVAAGNGPSGGCTEITNTAGPAAPACVQNATAVGAVNDADSSISYQRGALFELLAPGININSTYNGGYLVQSGTSMAAPHVAGAFALFRQFFRVYNNRVPTPDEIKTTINNTGVTISDSGTGYNFQRINVYSAIDYLRKPRVEKIYPLNNSYKNLANQNLTFTCNVTGNNYLVNVTFYLWNSSSIIYNETINITGTNNQTNFSYNFSVENTYLWDCIAYNNQNFSNSNLNYTLTYDITNPIISSVSSSVSTTTSTITWTTNENANSSVNYGTSISLGSINSSSTLTTSHSISLSSLSSSTTYYYNVTSCDSSGNCVTNSSYSFTTSSGGGNNGGGGGGGGGASISSAKTYEPTIEEISSPVGYTQTLSKDDKIKFTFFDEKSEQHSLIVNNVTNNSVSLTIQSEVIKLTLGIGQSAKLNLTDENYYNFYVKLNSIAKNKADITIQTIHEQIPKPSITGNVVKESEEDKIKNEIPQTKQINIGGYAKDFLIVILIITVLVILFSKKNMIREKEIREYKEKFEKYIKPKK